MIRKQFHLEVKPFYLGTAPNHEQTGRLWFWHVKYGFCFCCEEAGFGTWKNRDYALLTVSDQRESPDFLSYSIKDALGISEFCEDVAVLVHDVEDVDELVDLEGEAEEGGYELDPIWYKIERI